MGWKDQGHTNWRRAVAERAAAEIGSTLFICEVGVHKGHLSKELLNYDMPTQLVLVDPYEPDSYNKTMRVKKNHKMLDEMYFKTLMELCDEPAGDRVRFLRLPSLRAAEFFPDGYFDLVFIDAEHTPEAIEKDIAAWRPKVRKGGVLAGDDYWQKYPEFVKKIDELIPKKDIMCERVWWSQI